MSIPLVTLAGLIDGVNPCAIGILVLLLGYLIVFAQKEKQVFKIGLVYILTVYATYLAIGLVFFRSVSFLTGLGFSWRLRKIIGGVLLLAGLVNLKDFAILHWGNWGNWGVIRWLVNFHLEVPGASHGILRKYVERSTVPATIILGVLVTLFETPCSLPIYVGTTTILAQSGLAPVLIMLYFLYYNFLFILPLIVIWQIVWRGKKIVEIREWEHKAKKWMKLSLGLLLLIMGIWMVK